VTKQRAWIGFWILAIIWGSSFLFIRIGVEQLTTFQVVFIRTGIAAIGLNIVAYMRGKRLPTDWKSIRDLLVLGVVNTVFPFILITWGEKYIESSLAAILQGTAALFTMVVAHFVFVDERMTPRKIAGLIIGFVGVVILDSRSTNDPVVQIDPTLHLLGQLAIVAASFCYALGGTYSRTAIQNRLEPIIAAAGAMTVTAIITGILTYVSPYLGGPQPAPLADWTPRVLGAMVALGFVNTFIAYIIFYALIPALGAARTSMVTYVIPAVGLVLGAIFLDEAVDIRLLIGAALIMGSIAIVNLKVSSLLRRAPAVAPQAVQDGS
jgi:drug/metabolite transporter (DMT)-like permease